jgi:hypothetical protein
VANWPSQQAAIDDLRRFVNDGSVDRPVKRKQVIGRVDGVNANFMTWDDRIIGPSLIVSVDDAPYAPAQVVVDDPILGTFHLIASAGPPVAPPPLQSTVRAAYYFQYFLDSELNEALMMSAQIILEGDDPTLIASGLKPAAMHFGASFAYGKQAMRWAQRKSAQFLLEEEPLSDDVMNRSNLFQRMSDAYYNKGLKLRDSFYMRDGRRNVPSFNIFKPNTSPTPPFPRR